MAAMRYRRFLKLCEDWSVDESKRGRDLGAFLRQRVVQAFREGESTQIHDPEVCDQMFDSLNKMNNNFYREKVSCKWLQFTGHTLLVLYRQINCRYSDMESV